MAATGNTAFDARLTIFRPSEHQNPKFLIDHLGEISMRQNVRQYAYGQSAQHVVRLVGDAGVKIRAI